MLTNDRELAVEVDGSGPPVVFLHVLGGTSNVFQIQADIVAAHIQAIRIDFAGAGDQFLSDHLDDLGRAGTAGDLGCAVLSVATVGAVVRGRPHRTV